MIDEFVMGNSVQCVMTDPLVDMMMDDHEIKMDKAKAMFRDAVDSSLLYPRLFTTQKQQMEEAGKRTAMFLDMDDTIIETKSGAWPPEDITDWKIKDNMKDRLLWAQDNFGFIFVVSNQGGIEAGYHTYEDVKAKFRCIESVLETNGIKFKHMLFAPYNSYHYNRKPNPGFAYEMARKYELDLSRSVMIGDASGIMESVTVGGLEDRPEGTYFIGNAPNVGWVSGEPVPTELMDKIVNDNGTNKIYWRKDFSDSDKMFAKNAGMKYMDVETFLAKPWGTHTSFMFNAR
jgi:D-glycero-D-manno-heptose 1,7-bisphosphate phosphatase